MPFDDDHRPAPPRRPPVSPSAPSELFWTLFVLARRRELPESPFLDALRAQHPELGERARSLWNDDTLDFGEIFVLARRGDTLFDADLDRFFARFEEACREDSEPGLSTEGPSERAAVTERLRILREDPAQRARVLGVLQEAWELVRGEWERVGRDAVTETAQSWAARLDEGADVQELLPEGHIALRDPFTERFDRALARGRVALSPIFFSGGRGHVIELAGLWHAGAALDRRDDLVRRRAQAEVVANRLKVLSDPTRVAILSQLALSPMSVTQLASHFGLSQPTVSAHVRLLRDADLLDARKDGGRTGYTTTRAHVERLLDDAKSVLLGFCAK